MGKVSHLHVCVTGCHDREFLKSSLSSLPSSLSALDPWCFSVGLCGDILTVLTNWLWPSPLGPRWLTVLLLPSTDGIGLVPRKTSLVLCVLRVPTIFFLTVDRFNSRRKSNFLVHTEKLREHWMFYIPGVTKYCYLSLGGDAGEPN